MGRQCRSGAGVGRSPRNDGKRQLGTHEDQTLVAVFPNASEGAGNAEARLDEAADLGFELEGATHAYAYRTGCARQRAGLAA